MILLYILVVAAVISGAANLLVRNHRDILILRVIETISKVVNQVSSSVILVPIQLALCFAVIFLYLLVIFGTFVLFEIDPLFKVYLILSIWMMTVQIFPNWLFDLIERLVNSIGDFLKLPKTVSSFTMYLFKGKIIVYLVAFLLVIFNNFNSISLTTKIKLPEVLVPLREVFNISVLTFLALDRIIEGVKKWYRDENEGTVGGKI